MANLAVAITKLLVGVMIQSASLTADGYHSLSDGSSNIVGLIGITLASKPIDEDHPYGHHKYENLTSLFIAGMLFFISGKILMDAIGNFMSPVEPQVSAISLAALIVTLGINIFVALYEGHMGKKLNSYVLISDATHTRSDIFISCGVLFTLIGVKLGLPPIIDPIISVIISGFIIKAAFEILLPAVGILTDKIAVDKEQVKAVVKSFPVVKDVHKVRSRGSQSGIYVELHVLVDPKTDVETAHKLSHDIQDRLRETIQPELEANVHIEPYLSNNQA